MTDATQRLHDFLASERDRQVAFLADIIRTPSDNPPGDCTRHAEHAASLLESLGCRIMRHAVPASLCSAHGLAGITNLIVRHRFGDGPTIALNAHGDVVPPGDGWTKDPYGGEIVDGWIYGRGAAVSKSDFATYVWALLALKSLRVPLRGTVEIHLTYDEETGGELGPAWLMDQHLSKPDYAIAAGFSYSVVNAHNGCLHLEVEVHGKSAHAARPTTGIDALEAATAILSSLYAWKDRLGQRVSAAPGIGSSQLTIGLIQGGTNTNVVPDRVAFRLDRRLIPEEDGVEAEAELRGIIEAAARACPGIQTKIRRILLAQPLRPTADSNRLGNLLCAHASAIFGEDVTMTGVPLYTDARHYATRNVPVVLYGAGPRTIEEANAHRADERVLLQDLYRATEVVARALLDLLSNPSPGVAGRDQRP